MKNKSFDCVEMKRKAQEQIYKETCNLSREQELNYFHKAAENFWQEIKSLREEYKTKPTAKDNS